MRCGVKCEVVRVLRFERAVNARALRSAPHGNDFRLICTCQRDAARERNALRRSWRRAARMAKGLSRRSIAMLIGVPLAFGAIGIPIEAMNVRLPIPGTDTVLARSQREYSLFRSGGTRGDLLSPDMPRRSLSLALAKEDFFRAQVPYGSIIYAEAKKNRLAPELVAAVIEAESDFRPRLVSNKNAQGLMQIMPSTGRDLGAGDLFNPAQNIAAGAKYLRYLHDRFRDERLALAAYNAGEGNVERFGGVPPFSETRVYLERVASRAQRYRQRIRGRYVVTLRMQSSASLE